MTMSTLARRAWRIKNRERIRAYDRARYRRNREQVLARQARARREAPHLTQARARELFRYDPKTGELRWRKAHGPGGRFPAGMLASPMMIIDRRPYLLHRVIWVYVYGTWPVEIDHRNGNPRDNRLRNLRACTHAENTRNRGAERDGSSGLKGVYWDRSRQRWSARIGHEGRGYFLGRFASKVDAARAYDEAACRLHGSFARVNGV